MYAHLLNIQKELGEENFPLIDQSFYASASEMVKLKSFKAPHELIQFLEPQRKLSVCF